jgi:hypothetical protein
MKGIKSLFLSRLDMIIINRVLFLPAIDGMSPLKPIRPGRYQKIPGQASS